MFLQEDGSFDYALDRFVGQSLVAYALNEADKRNLDYVIGSSDDTLRLYTTNPDAGFGSRGRTDTLRRGEHEPARRRQNRVPLATVLGKRAP